MNTDVLAPSTPAPSTLAHGTLAHGTPAHAVAPRPVDAPPVLVRRRPALVEEQDRRVLAALGAGDREFLRATTGAAVTEGHPLPPLAFHVARDRRSRALTPGRQLELGYLHHLVEEWGLVLTAAEFGNALRYVRRRDAQSVQRVESRTAPAQHAAGVAVQPVAVAPVAAAPVVRVELPA